MNIIYFKEKVYQRIILQYFKDVRKTKLTLRDYLYFPTLITSQIIVFSIASYFLKADGSLLHNLLPNAVKFVSGFALLFGILYSLASLSTFWNFKKQSDKFWGTTLLDLPVLNNSELSLYLKQYVEVFLSKKEYMQKDVNKLLMFTVDELEDMKTISFNNNQKDFMVNNIKKGHPINFYCLEGLIERSDENVEKTEKENVKLFQEKMNSNQFILDAIQFKPEVEMEMGQCAPLKQKIKQLL